MTGDSYVFLDKAVRGSSSVEKKKTVESLWIWHLDQPKAQCHLCTIIYFKITVLYIRPYFSSLMISRIWSTYSRRRLHMLIIYEIMALYVSFYLALPYGYSLRSMIKMRKM